MADWLHDDPSERAISAEGMRESKRANQALRDYLLMGPARSLRKLRANYQAQPIAPTTSWATLSKWSVEFEWVARSKTFDDLQHQKALDEYEARWKDKIMGSTEVLGRLSDQARGDISQFVTVKQVPAVFIFPGSKDEKDDEDEGSTTGPVEMVQVVELNWDEIRKNGHLIKSITNTKYGPRIELYDGQDALVNVGRHLKLFTDQQDINSSMTVTFSADDLAAAKARAKAFEDQLDQ